ncbi:TetR/AcrR family transcriptional regulator [Arcanobacterium hippocoleae]
MAGVREAKHAANLQRILEAGSELFEQHDYADVTTNMLAQRADVSVGTLFRHIGSKAALLVSVIKKTLHQPVQTLRPATTIPLAIQAVMALVEPFLDLAVRQPKNVIVFQREVLYGEADGSEVVGIVQALEPQIGEIVAELRGIPSQNLTHTLYSVIYMDFLQATTGSARMEDLPERMRESVSAVLYNWR